MVSEVISYRGKSALREVGKAFGLSLEQADRLSGMLSHSYSGIEVTPESVQEVGLDPNDERIRQIVSVATQLLRFSEAPVDPRGRVRALGRAARRGCTGRAGAHAGTHGDSVGQGRSRRTRFLQGRHPRARDADVHPQGAGSRDAGGGSVDRTCRHPAGGSGASTTPCARPTRSGSSRWKAGRRWRCCPGSSRAGSTTS